jgi:hypothetical protein
MTTAPSAAPAPMPASLQLNPPASTARTAAGVPPAEVVPSSSLALAVGAASSAVVSAIAAVLRLRFLFMVPPSRSTGFVPAVCEEAPRRR